MSYSLAWSTCESRLPCILTHPSHVPLQQHIVSIIYIYIYTLYLAGVFVWANIITTNMTTAATGRAKWSWVYFY